MITIRFVKPPEVIVFSIEDATYILTHHASLPRSPYTVREVGEPAITTNNINEWLALKTRGRCGLDHLHDLANAFLAGKNSAYGHDDLVKCADLAFDHASKMLFRDGLAGRYAELFDIECMTLSEIKRKLKEARETQYTSERIARFVRVCERNGWMEMADAWSRLTRSSQLAVVEQRDVPAVDELIRRSIKNQVYLEFQRSVEIGEDEWTPRG